MYEKELQRYLDKLGIEPGDKVRVIKNGKCYEGILLPRIEYGDKRCIVLKLDNGYNIGIRYEKDVKIEKLEEHRELAEFPKIKVKQREDLPKISILFTGGTIASKVDYITGAVTPAFEPEELLALIPELQDIVCLKKVKHIMSILSENMQPKYWQKIAKEVADELNSDVKGIVVPHGTDTMHYTASALAFMLKNLGKPVILTGAQRSSDRGSSDAAFNLICSAYACLSNIAEVCICMHATSSDNYCFALRGVKARKMHTSRRDAFRSINCLPLAKIWPNGKVEYIGEYKKRNDKAECYADVAMEEKVTLIKAYPGATPEIVDFYVDKGYKGIVIEGTGLGHVCVEGENSWLPSIQRAVEEGLAVVMTSQCIYGRTHPFVYDTARILYKAGVIYASDMLPEVAYVKLMWVLAHVSDMREVRKLMLTNIAREISERSLYKTFLI